MELSLFLLFVDCSGSSVNGLFIAFSHFSSGLFVLFLLFCGSLASFFSSLASQAKGAAVLVSP